MRPSRKILWFLGVLACLFLAFWVGFYQQPLNYFNHLLYFQMSVSGAHSRWVTVDGIRIHYYVKGPDEGAPVVLIHGLGGHSEDWRALAPYMVGTGRLVYMPDLPGHGRSDWPKDFSYSIPDQAKVIADFMDAVGVNHIDLGGWSMGGWIAQRVALDHPDRIKRLMLFDSAGLHDRPTWNTNLFVPKSASELDQLDALLMPHPPQVPAFIASDILRFSGRHGWVIHKALDSMLQGKDTTDAELSNLKMPVLLVWGADDHITPVAQGEKMHQLMPQSELDVIQGCGHLAALQCSSRIGPEVEDFLKRWR